MGSFQNSIEIEKLKKAIVNLDIDPEELEQLLSDVQLIKSKVDHQSYITTSQSAALYNTNGQLTVKAGVKPSALQDYNVTSKQNVLDLIDENITTPSINWESIVIFNRSIVIKIGKYVMINFSFNLNNNSFSNNQAVKVGTSTALPKSIENGSGASTIVSFKEVNADTTYKPGRVNIGLDGTINVYPTESFTSNNGVFITGCMIYEVAE